MKNLYLFLLAVGLGFVTAIPVGGSVSSDIMYGVIALFGVAPFLESPWVMAVFSAVGARDLGFFPGEEGPRPQRYHAGPLLVRDSEPDLPRSRSPRRAGRR